jgi:hypothetical protein
MRVTCDITRGQKKFIRTCDDCSQRRALGGELGLLCVSHCIGNDQVDGDTRVVHQDVQRSKRFLRLIEEAPYVGGLGHIALYGNRFATLFHDLRDYAVCTLFA